MLPALMAFDAPYAIVFDEVGDTGMPHTGTLEGLARRMGKRAISSELGGGGRVTPASLSVAAQGLRNVLAHIGVRPDREATRPEQSRSQLLALSRKEHYVPAPATGRLAPRAMARGRGARRRGTRPHPSAGGAALVARPDPGALRRHRGSSRQHRRAGARRGPCSSSPSG